MLLFARENYEKQYLESSITRTISKDRAMQIKNMLNASILGGFAWLLQASSIILLIHLGNKGLVTPGDFALILMLSITVIDQVWFLTENLLTIGEQVGICQKAIETIYTPHLQKRNAPEKQLVVSNGDITLKNIYFQYDKDRHIFENLNLHIPARKKWGWLAIAAAAKVPWYRLSRACLMYNKVILKSTANLFMRSIGKA